MRRVAWSQLRFRTARSLALLLGMVFAVTSFTVLTAASRTAQLRATHDIAAHFGAAYQILVRPRGARTRLEEQTGTVQPNFLSGIYGGIRLAQYRTIEGMPGVSVAAPIAMIGYVTEFARIPVELPAGATTSHRRELYRVTTTWVSGGGSSRIVQPPSFVYVTPDRLDLDHANGGVYEVTPAGARSQVCPYQPPDDRDPFGVAGQSQAWCWSDRDGLTPSGAPAIDGLSNTTPGLDIDWSFPMLVAAIDPVAEAKLDGLNRAVASGRYLGEHVATRTLTDQSGDSIEALPVLASSASGIGEYASTQIQQLPSPARPPLLNLNGMIKGSGQRGQTVLTSTTTAQQAYQRLLPTMRSASLPGAYFTGNAYWTVSPTSYRRSPNGSLTANQIRNPDSVWRQIDTGYSAASMDDDATQYRTLHEHAIAQDVVSQSQGNPLPQPDLVGEFNPARIKSADPLAAVPLGLFQATTASPADASARQALHDGNLEPSLNMGGYVGQPPELLTTLTSLPAWENTRYLRGIDAQAPISVIRVRVAGVTGPNPVSLERIREVAQQIAVRTGLDVDIVAGSSPAPTTVSLPAGRFGQPALLLSEGWVKLGVAVAVLDAVDKKSVVLFALILIVCALFIANSATAAVRGRRRELGVLACLGWSRPRLFGIVFGELAGIGLAAGVIGGLLSLPAAAGLHLHASAGRAVLAVPAAVGLAIVAGAGPAWLAARADPLESVRPPMLAVHRARSPAGLTGLALGNVLRAPGRTLVGALSLAVGTTALTLIISVELAFRGTVVGSLLGDAVAVQIRGPDYVAVVVTVVLGVLAVLDVLFVSIRERAAELATVRALGWTERDLGRLIVTEGALIGLTGSVTGAVLGLAAAAAFAGQLPGGLLLAAAAAVVAGIAITTAGALLPARLLRNLPTAALLAEE